MKMAPIMPVLRLIVLKKAAAVNLLSMVQESDI